MSKHALYQQYDEDLFCSCDAPNFTTSEIHTQTGGNIKSYTLGVYCTNCGKDKTPPEPQTEDDTE